MMSDAPCPATPEPDAPLKRERFAWLPPIAGFVGLLVLILGLLSKGIYAVATSKPFTDLLAFIGAIAALFSGLFWYMAAKQTLVPHTSELMTHIINLFNFWAGELSAVSGVCIAMSLGLKRE
jgi:hypothetical protein